MKSFPWYAIRPRIRSFLTTYYRETRAFDIQTQLRMRALDTTCEYIEKNMVDILLCESREETMHISLKAVSIDGNYCEFGVWKGESANYIAKSISQNLHAFDSFEGLPEKWLNSHQKGHFKLDKLPSFEKNVVPHKGWFSDTLPEWVEKHPENIAFLHVDCDLYSSTKTIFEYLAPKIVKGTIILFDEYFNYPFWQHHEYKAFQEFVALYHVEYEYLCYGTNKLGSKVGVRILNRSSA